MAFAVSWALEIIQNEYTAMIPLFREGKAMLRDRPVGQYGIKTVGDQGFQNMGEILLLTLDHAVQ